jgi:hypothetical protein
MNRQIIRLSINIDLIEQARLYPGRKGRYLDATLFLNEETDQYGNNGFIAQSVTKEEREAGVKGPIIGNVKLPKNNQAPAQYPATQPVNNPYPTNEAPPRKPKAVALPPVTTVDPEDLPF